MREHIFSSLKMKMEKKDTLCMVEENSERKMEKIFTTSIDTIKMIIPRK